MLICPKCRTRKGNYGFTLMNTYASYPMGSLCTKTSSGNCTMPYRRVITKSSFKGDWNTNRNVKTRTWHNFSTYEFFLYLIISMWYLVYRPFQFYLLSKIGFVRCGYTIYSIVKKSTGL